MNKKFLLVVIAFVIAGAVLGGIFGKMPLTSAGSSTTTETITKDYSEAIDLIDNNYVANIDHEKISESSIQGMLWTLDPHSSFFTTEEFRKLEEEQSSQFYGIGVSILQHRDGVYVQSIIPNTPADKAGLKYGDRFLQVEGKDATKWTSAEVSRNVRGEKGTLVNIRMERVAADKPIDLTISRGPVPLPSIRNYFMLPNGIGYVGLTGGFQQTTAAELDEAVGNLKKQGMKSLLLDLRGNPGGILEQAIEIVSRFVPAGQTVVSVKGRSRYVKARELKTTGKMLEDLPLVIMINSGSASASEIVAGAIQDYDRGVIVGSDSFGKGLVQGVFPLPFGTGLTLTTARYYTPFGRSLQRDYSSGSIYDYYTHQTEDSDGTNSTDTAPKPVGSPVTAANGRTLYGGRGIEPDVKVEGLKFTPIRIRLNEAAFYFVRQLAAGKVAGLESYKVDKQNFDMTIQSGDLQINDKMLEAFRAYTISIKENGLSAENVNSQIDYAKSRLREELATANRSNEAGAQVLLETDPQVLKAIEAMSDAKNLTQSFAQNYLK
jgi:carboxyl-terminal processing protease